ncbi:unnamed protein product [Polarella glacialis]|uniref:Calmodulin n=1 Tax=Polarella glacialis TaxID=89957 RepID=A0A813M0J4_POLGL|nr:unnamed protein product [Polarella glacialis]
MMTIKLIDFGLAKRFLGFVPRDQFLEIVGTSHYMAPEMMLDGKYSPAVDMWSLGVLLYVCLTGMMLLPKDDERKKCCLRKKGFVQRKIQNCAQLQKRGCSEQARDLLGKMLKLEPLQRITASEALSHPFILNHCHLYLGEPFETNIELDPDLVGKLRRYAKAPRLKKVSLLFMAHLADHEKDLLAARHNFRTLDQDGDGEISQEDLEVGLKASGVTPPADMAEIFAACSGHREGRLHFVEFVACLLPEQLVDERLCHEAFNLLDPEGKGQLTAEDLQVVCPTYDLQRCQKMVRQANSDGNGDFFDFEHFHRFLCGPAERSKRQHPDADDAEGEPHAQFVFHFGIGLAASLQEHSSGQFDAGALAPAGPYVTFKVERAADVNLSNHKSLAGRAMDGALEEASGSHGQHLEIESALLATLFSRCSVQALLRLEAAVGTRLCRELREHPAHAQNWAQALAVEGGLAVETEKAGSISVPGPPVTLSKAALRLARASQPLADGWCGLEEQDVESCAWLIHQLDASSPAGRVLRDPETGRTWGQMERLALVHFDERGCFGEDWASVVEGFRQPASEASEDRPPARAANAQGATCYVDGAPVQLRLGISAFDGNPEGGFYVDLDIEQIRPCLRPGDVLRVACVLRCGSIVRQSGLVFHHCGRAVRLVDADHFWHFVPFRRGMSHVLSIDVVPWVPSEEGSSAFGPGGTAGDLKAEVEGEEFSAFRVEEDLGTAQWNIGLTEGTALVPLVWPCENEFAERPFPPEAFAGSVALLRRGGGLGFAHKALAARDAGAVGCIIYEAEGDRESLGCVWSMGQRFKGTNYPDPGIPSVLVGASDGLRLVTAAASRGGACVRLSLERSQEALRRLSSDFEAFRDNVRRGEAVRLAVLLERASLDGHFPPQTELQEQEAVSGLSGLRLDWFLPGSDSLADRRKAPPEDPDSVTWVSIATVILILGLDSLLSDAQLLSSQLPPDNAGKTTILYRLQVDEVVQTIPTIGFNVETVQYKNIKFQVWDLGGQTSIRPYWRCYYPNTNAIIYVVDSADPDRIGDSKEELRLMLEEEELKSVTLLVLANKQDLPGAMSAAEVSESLGLTAIRNRQWAIFQTSALKGSGINEGLDWLVSVLSSA